MDRVSLSTSDRAQVPRLHETVLVVGWGYEETLCCILFIIFLVYFEF